MPPPSQPLAIENLEVNVTGESVDVTYQTNVPTASRGAAGLDGVPAIWTPADTAALVHEAVFRQLSPATRYRIWIQALDPWNRTTTTTLTVRTPPVDGQIKATVSGDTILVNERPFFPLAIWNACTNEAGAKIHDGINLFMAEGCGHEATLPAALSGKALSVVDASSGLTQGPGLIGWYYPDELDGRLSAPVLESDVSSMGVTAPPGMLRFLTVTNHFYSGANPLPIGRSLYPTFFGLADVLGFDLYPMQNWCRDDRIGDVYESQRELDQQTGHKPTFQWIEVRVMDCAATPALTPTRATVRAETWLAIAGGADAIGYFPHDWSADIGMEITDVDRRIKELAPALLSDDVAASAAPWPLKVGVRALNGAIYVIAVNPTRTSLSGTLNVAGLAGRTLSVVGEQRQVTAVGGAINDTFEPLAVHIYIAAPQGWSPTVTTEPEGEAESRR